jgi:hypothetical protein
MYLTILGCLSINLFCVIEILFKSRSPFLLTVSDINSQRQSFSGRFFTVEDVLIIFAIEDFFLIVSFNCLF